MGNLSRNADVPAQPVTGVEGRPAHGSISLKAMMTGDLMTVLEIRYAPGAGTSTHVHQHESIVYVASGRVRMRVGDERYELGPGDVCRHPQGVPHSVEGIEDSLLIEIKSPPQRLEAFLNTAKY